jgi:hypothetical protein
MRFAVRPPALAGVLAFGVLALAGAAPPPDPLAALAAANGHAANVHLRATGTRVVEGRTITTTLEQLGAQRLFRHCVNEVCDGTWFDGAREWTFGINEIALPEEADDALPTERTLFAIVSFAFAEPAFRAAGGSVVHETPSRWRIRARDGAELVATIDPPSAALRSVVTPAGRPVAVYGREMRAGGASFALDRAGPFESGPLDHVAVAAGPIGPPSGVAVTLAADAPLALRGDAIPVVACSIGGRPARCLLDTGATPSAMTLQLAEALGLEPHGELEIAGVGRFATGLVEAGPLALGPARFERARFAVVPQSSGTRLFDLVVGSDLLGRVRVVVDRGRGTVRFLPSGGAAPAGAIPLAFRNGSPMVDATLGSQPLRALLDTGDAALFSLGYADYRAGPQWPVVARAQALGVGGADDVLTIDVPDLQVGALQLGRTRASVRRTQRTPHLGIGLWDRFAIDLDEAAERVSFSPR